MTNNMIAYCGIDCGACKLYLATVRDSNTERQAVLEDWNAKYGLSLTLADMNCLGCKSDLVYKYCTQCDIKDCGIAKGLDICPQCDAYACQRILEFYQHQEKANPEYKLIKA